MDIDEATREDFRTYRDAQLASKRREHGAMRRDMDKRFARSDRDREFVLEQLRVAQPWEYAAWLAGYLANGGEATHFYDYPTPTMWTALTNLELRPLYGADAFGAILVPEGLTAVGDTGHTHLFLTIRTPVGREYMQRGFHDRGPRPPHFVPVYADTEL